MKNFLEYIKKNSFKNADFNIGVMKKYKESFYKKVNFVTYATNG